MNLQYGLVGGLFGLLFGSAINAMVWRLYVGRSWAKGRSECPDCGHVLAAKDLVPILSWMALRGKCRYCHKPIQDHPVVELVTALLFGLSAALLAPTGLTEWVELGFWLIILVLLIVLAVYDARWLLLPDKIMLPLAVIAAVYSGTMAYLVHSQAVFLGSAIAALAAGGVFWALVAGSKGRAMGGGDIKLAFVMGLILGVQGTAVALLRAFNVAAIVGVLMIAVKRRGRETPIPFGPYLVGGTIAAFIYGRTIVDWYLHLNGLGS
jgi:prepilin signal peptidase PulO-like enzyme (type II secretory pathway)